MKPGTTWGGKPVTEARKYMAMFLPKPCARCGGMINPGDQWVIGHIKSRAEYPELTWNLDNWQHEHRSCSNKTGQATVQANAARRALKAAGVTLPPSPVVFPQPTPASKPPPLSISPSQAQRPSMNIPERLAWDKDALSSFHWLLPLLDIPADSSPPLAMTRPHPDAVGSYGESAIQFIEHVEKKRLRWWQKLAITRQLEHRADGTLCWRVIVESCSRRSGKSVRIRGMALWRMANPELIGETQTVLHCGNDLPICREIQRWAWNWAKSVGWTVTKANGKEAIETPDGDRWLVRSQDGAYGFEAGLAVVDESWDVKPETVSEGLEPAMVDRRWRQLHLTSTAHRRATSLMKNRIINALADDDGKTLLMLWAAPSDADISDPAVWKAASPHWTEDRHEMIADKYAKALAGEVDPDADELDPMQAFTAQYLNQWQLTAKRREVGVPVVSEPSWASLAVELPSTVPDAVAVEGWPTEGLSVARAWHMDNQVIVTTQNVPDIATAALLVSVFRCRRPALVGSSLAEDPAWTKISVTKTTGALRGAIGDLARLLDGRDLLHDGDDHLTKQVLALRTSPAADGIRIRSTGRADAVKAAVWAAHAARTRPVGRPRIIVAV